MKYEVWRYYQKIGTFTFSELKHWMLAQDAFKDYHSEIQSATRAITKNYNRKRLSLDWIAVDTNYCCIKRVEE